MKPGVLLDGIRSDVEREWGSGFNLLGPRIQRALLLEAVLAWVNRVNELVDDNTVRRVIKESQQWAWEETGT